MKLNLILLSFFVHTFANPVIRQGLLPEGGSRGTPCSLALEACKSLEAMPGASCPQCDAKGLFEPIQSSGSTGYSYCVSPITGKEINGTATPPTQPKPVCSCQGMTTAKNSDGIAMYCGPCNVNQTQTPACYSGSIGGYCPQCNTVGDFSSTQMGGGTGYMWCVNPTTGSTINGTLTPPAMSPKPECTCEWMRSNGNVEGQNAYCLLTAPPTLGSKSSAVRLVAPLFALLFL
jgi:hypothetical protein